MKRTLKTIAAAIIIIATLVSYPAFSSAGFSEKTIWFAGEDRYYMKESGQEYKGRLTEGENNITINDGVYSFTAPKTGYYGADIGCYGAYMSEAVAGNKVLKYDIIGGCSGPDGSLYSDNECIYPLYLRKGEKKFFYFFTQPLDQDMSESEPVFEITDGKAEIICLSEVTCAYLKDNTLYSGCEDIHYYPHETSCLNLHTPVEITFNKGKKYCSDYIFCLLDNTDAGEHNVKAEIVKNRGFDITINIINPEDLIERVELPKGFVPEATVYYCKYGFRFYDETYPDYITFFMKDGKKIRLYRQEDCGYGTLTLKGRSQLAIYGWYAPGDDGNILFAVRSRDYSRPEMSSGRNLSTFEAQAHFLTSPAESTIGFLSRIRLIVSSFPQQLQYYNLSRAMYETNSSLASAVKDYNNFISAEKSN